MPTTKITDLTAYTDPVNTDVLPIVDVTSDVTKKVSIANMMKNASLGSAAAPGISFDGDPNTGIYSPGADQVAISTNGQGRLFINSSGQVGVGTSSPVNKTVVVDSATGSIPTSQEISASSSGAVQFGVWNSSDSATYSAIGLETRTNAASRWMIANERSGDYTGDLVFRGRNGTTTSAEIVRFTSSGRVGVGTTSPSATLDVSGDIKASGTIGINGAAAQAPLDAISNASGYGIVLRGRSSDNEGRLRFTSNNYASIYSELVSTSSALAFNVNGSERLRIDSSGRVGIGTSSPNELLEVRGTQDQGIRLTSTAGSGEGANLQWYSEQTGDNKITAEIESDGSGTGGNLFFKTRSTAGVLTDRLLIDNAGRVGIGTTSPGVALDCTGAISAQGGNAPTGGFQLPDTSGTKQPRITNDAGNATVIRAGSATGGVKFNNFANSSELVTIDNSGRLLVGTSSSVQVYQGATTFNSELQVAGSSASLTIARSVGSGNLFLARNQTVIDGSTLGVISFNGGDGTNIRQAAEISVVVDGTPGTGDMPGRIVLATTADGASSPTERMRISNNGVVTIKNGAVAEIGTLTDGATITPNFASNCNFTVTLGGARTIANPTNVTAGQSGSIFIVQDGTGGRTASWGSNWDWAGGTAPTLSTGANAVDRVDYICRSATSIHAVYTGNYS